MSLKTELQSQVLYFHREKLEEIEKAVATAAKDGKVRYSIRIEDNTFSSILTCVKLKFPSCSVYTIVNCIIIDWSST